MSFNEMMIGLKEDTLNISFEGGNLNHFFSRHCNSDIYTTFPSPARNSGTTYKTDAFAK